MVSKNLVLTMALAASCAFTSCAPKEEKHEATLSVSGFEDYVRNSEKAAKEVSAADAVEVTDLIIEFGTLPSANQTGLCEVSGDSTPKITVNEKIWATLDFVSRQQVLFHEMGHCVLHRNHNAEMDSNMGLPKSMMYPFRINGQIYSQFMEQFHEELFDPSKRGQF